MAVSSSKEPNLTPFIDLLSILVCFLMMTAAWVYLDAFQSSLEKPPSDADAPAPQASAPKDEKPKVRFVAHVRETTVELLEDERRKVIPHLNSAVDVVQVEGVLKDWRRRHPDRKDVKLQSDSAAFYGDVIAMFDILTGTGWSEVAMNAK